MAEFEFTSPDGRKFRVSGESRDGAIAAFEQFMSSSQPAPRQETGRVSGAAANATQGFLFGFGDEYMAGLSALLGVQPDGKGGARWLDYEKPVRERYDAALGAIRSEMGQFREDNPVTAIGSQVAGGIAGAVAGAAGLARAGALPATAGTAAGRAGQVAAGGAAAGAVEGFGSGEGGFGNRMVNMGVGGVVGGVAAPLVGIPIAKVSDWAIRKGGNLLQAALTNPAVLDPQTGQITAAGRQRIQDLGFDPDILTQEMQQAFLDTAARAVGTQAADQPETIARMATATRFGVPLTRGQATGEVTQSGLEESMRAGGRGQGAANIMEAFGQRQQAAVEEARGAVVQTPGMNATDRIDAAERVIQGVQREAEAARQAGRAAYNALAESGDAVNGMAGSRLAERLTNSVSRERVRVSRSNTPNAAGMADAIRDVFTGTERGSIPFETIESLRQQMLRYQRAAMSGSNGADQTASQAMVRAYDDWLDDTITNALVQGDGQALNLAKDARQAWARYRQTYLSREGADNYIRKIVEEEVSPDQVGGWLMGASRQIGGGQTSLVATRLRNILGAESQEWQAVRRAAWDRVTAEGGPQRVANNIRNLLDDKGQTLGRVLFTDQERATMREFANMLDTLVPPRRATNPSGTGHLLQREIIGMLGSVAGGSGGPVGAIAGRAAVNSGNNFTGTLAARAAAAGIPVRPTAPAMSVGAGVGAGAALQEQVAR